MMNISNGWRQIRWGVLVIDLALAILLLSAVSGESAEQQPLQPKKVAASSPSAAIPLAEITVHATEVLNLLGTLQAQLAPSTAFEEISKQAPKVNGHIDLLLEGTVEILQRQPPLAALQSQRQIWQGLELQTSGWLKELKERIVKLRDALNRLAALQELWTKTDEAAKAAKAPDVILQQSGAVLAAINEAQQWLQAQSNDVLDLQSRVAGIVGRCQNVSAQIGLAQKEAVGGILVRDGLPIWTTDLWVQGKAQLSARFRGNIDNCREDIQQYLSNPSVGMPLHVGIFLALMLIFWVARRRVDHWKKTGDSIPFSATVFDHPYAAALIGTVFVATGPLSSAPQTVKYSFAVAALIPMIRLARPMIDRRMNPGLYGLAILFTVDVVRRTFDGLPFIGQAVLLLETAAGILMIGWFLTFGHLRRTSAPVKGFSQLQVFRIAAFLVVLILATGLAAGVLGYMRLAGLLASQILGGGAMALAFCAYFRVVTGFVAFALRVWPLRLLRMVQGHRDLLERRTHRVLIWLVAGGWLLRWLAYMGVLLPAVSLVEGMLALNLERGSVNISFGDVLVFFLTVWVAYLLSAFLRFVLQEDFYPRTQIAPGLSYAISSLLHYLILALGVVVGMGLMGMDLSRVTVLAGAFGVGIGFGLQSVVNNFVCGLILLFERPIHVGDMVEIGNLLGEVRHIGIRASTVHTRQGADIIVPNAQLVTEKVTNWTLSDKLRRLELPVGVNYGASPKKVIEILETVARATPRVLSNPPPRALFMGYGDSSINFELRVWTDESIFWRQVRSNLGVAVYDAVLEAGMAFPFPQREIRLVRNLDSTEK
jgi:potassium-dependent mechanosensitive channel